MADPPNDNCATMAAVVRAASDNAGDPPAFPESLACLYVHIPLCARLCPYCAFYKELLDRSQTPRNCESLLRELEQHAPHLAGFATAPAGRLLLPASVYLVGGTPAALTTSQLEF